MGKIIVYGIGLLVVFGGTFLLGVIVGGGWADDMAQERQLESVRACIDASGGRIDQAGLDQCLAQLEAGS